MFFPHCSISVIIVYAYLENKISPLMHMHTYKSKCISTRIRTNSIILFFFVEKSRRKTKIMSTFRFSLLQTQIIAMAAAGVAAEGLSPNAAKAEAENATHLSVALVENAIVILMLAEEHLRSQSKQSSSLRPTDGSPSPLSLFYPVHYNLKPLTNTSAESAELRGDRTSSSSNSGGVSLDVCIE